MSTMRSSILNWKKGLQVLFTVAMMISMTACEKSGSNEKEEDASHLSFSIQSLTVVGTGKNVLISPSLYDVAGNPKSFLPPMTWVSSNTGVATVSNIGRIKTVSLGESIIRVSYKNMASEFLLIVSNESVQISGGVSYQDKLYDDTNGIYATAFKPVRGGLVQLRDHSENLIDTTFTDMNGDFVFSEFIPDQYYLRVLVSDSENVFESTSVRDLSGHLYSWRSNAKKFSDGLHEFKIEGEVAGAFNIFDVMHSGKQYLQGFGISSFPRATVYWEPGNSEITGALSCITSSGCIYPEGIYLSGNTTANEEGIYNNDEWDDDIILHEFFHLNNAHLFHADSPGGCHSSKDNTLDLQLSWDEGLANFFSVSVKHWLYGSAQQSVAGDLEKVIDLASNGPSVVDVGLKGEMANQSFYRYSSSEFAIANILHNIRENFGAEPIYSLFRSSEWTPETVEGHSHDGSLLSEMPNNLEKFWDRIQLTSSLTREQLLPFFEDRDVLFKEDDFEPNDYNAQASAVPLPDAQLTLYKNFWDTAIDSRQSDVDVFFFEAQEDKTYVIETHNLKNGADTVLRVYNAGFTMDSSNDDIEGNNYLRVSEKTDTNSCPPAFRYHNDASSLASKLEITPTVSETLFVEVTSANKYSAAGRYGSYSLKITEK